MIVALALTSVQLLLKVSPLWTSDQPVPKAPPDVAPVVPQVTISLPPPEKNAVSVIPAICAPVVPKPVNWVVTLVVPLLKLTCTEVADAIVAVASIAPLTSMKRFMASISFQVSFP